MYQWELNRVQTDYRYNSLKPKQFELNINYRSHNGILRLASSVIDLIHHFFPDSIDQLSSEHGEVGGPRPLITDRLNLKKEKEDSIIEFGASQVIIVRDDDAKERFKDLYNDFEL